MPRWIMFRRRRRGETDNGRAATAALARATEDLRGLRRQRPEVDREVEKVRAVRRENHFAERWYEVLGGGG